MKNILTAAVLAASCLTALPQLKISQYPNTNAPPSNSLFIMAVGTTNKNISYGQLAQAITNGLASTAYVNTSTNGFLNTNTVNLMASNRVRVLASTNTTVFSSNDAYTTYYYVGSTATGTGSGTGDVMMASFNLNQFATNGLKVNVKDGPVITNANFWRTNYYWFAGGPDAVSGWIYGMDNSVLRLETLGAGMDLDGDTPAVKVWGEIFSTNDMTVLWGGQFIGNGAGLTNLTATGEVPLTAFNTNQFATNGSKVSIKTGPVMTNVVVFSSSDLNTPLSIYGASGQDVRFFSIYNSASNSVFYVDETGAAYGNGSGLTNVPFSNLLNGTNYWLGSNHFSGQTVFEGTNTSVEILTNLTLYYSLIASNGPGTNGQILYSQGTNQPTYWANAPTGGSGTNFDNVWAGSNYFYGPTIFSNNVYFSNTVTFSSINAGSLNLTNGITNALMLGTNAPVPQYALKVSATTNLYWGVDQTGGGDVTLAGNNVFTGSNTFTSGSTRFIGGMRMDGYITNSILTPGRALIAGASSDGTIIISHTTATSTDLGYLNGVTSSVQDQLNAKPGHAYTNVWTGTNRFNQQMWASNIYATNLTTETFSATTLNAGSLNVTNWTGPQAWSTNAALGGAAIDMSKPHQLTNAMNWDAIRYTSLSGTTDSLLQKTTLFVICDTNKVIEIAIAGLRCLDGIYTNTINATSNAVITITRYGNVLTNLDFKVYQP